MNPNQRQSDYNLDAICYARSNELTRILAGCLTIDPVWVQPYLDKLKPGALTDLNARRFIEAVKAELHTIQKASDYDQATIVVHIASEIGLLSDFCGWVFLPRNLYQDTPDCIRELQALSITQDTLAGFQDWIREVEILNEWH